MQDHYRIRFERDEDHASVRDLHDAAFGEPGAVSGLVGDLRGQDAVFPLLSLVSVDQTDRPLGHVMLSHAWLDGWDRLIDVMVLSPLGVLPEMQGKGIGTALIEAAVAEAEKLGVPMVFLEGSDRYYGPRGFEMALPLNIGRPSLRIPERAFQVRRLRTYDSSMCGTFVYRDVHWKHGVGRYRQS